MSSDFCVSFFYEMRVHTVDSIYSWSIVICVHYCLSISIIQHKYIWLGRPFALVFRSEWRMAMLQLEPHENVCELQ